MSSNSTMLTTYEVVELVVHGFLNTIISVVGIFGNIFLITLLKRRCIWKRLRIYLNYLAICDIALLISHWLCTSFLTLTIYGYLPRDVVMSAIYMRTYPYVYALEIASATAHMWGTVALTIERFLAICYPLKHKLLHPKYFPIGMLSFVALFSALYAVPKFFEIFVRESNSSQLQLEFEFVTDTPLYQYGYKWVLKLFVSSFGPLIIITVFTIRMIYTITSAKCRFVKQTPVNPRVSSLELPAPNSERSVSVSVCEPHFAFNKERPGSRHSSRRSSPEKASQRIPEAKANRPLIIVLMVAIVSYNVPTACDLILIICPVDCGTTLDYLFIIASFLVCFDAAGNFYIYVLSSAAFRRQIACSNHKRGQKMSVGLPSSASRTDVNYGRIPTQPSFQRLAEQRS